MNGLKENTKKNPAFIIWDKSISIASKKAHKQTNKKMPKYSYTFSEGQVGT